MVVQLVTQFSGTGSQRPLVCERSRVALFPMTGGHFQSTHGMGPHKGVIALFSILGYPAAHADPACRVSTGPAGPPNVILISAVFFFFFECLRKSAHAAEGMRAHCAPPGHDTKKKQKKSRIDPITY